MGDVMEVDVGKTPNLGIVSLSQLIGPSKYSGSFFSWLVFRHLFLALSASFAVRGGSASQGQLVFRGARDGCIKDVGFQEHSMCVCNLETRQNKARKMWL